MDNWRQELAENMDQYRLGQDDKFRFKCLECGKCCKNREDIMLTTRDLYNIARKMKMTIEDVLETYCQSYIGQDSRIPIVRLLPRGSTKACPLLRDKRCMVHDAKPAVCALYPLGRAVMREKGDTDSLFEAIHPTYFLQPVSCGSQTRTNTVRSWLEKFGIPLEDEFFALWNEAALFLSQYFRKLEDNKTPDAALEILWTIAFGALYATYDTGVDLMPQFRENTTKLKQVLADLDVQSIHEKALAELSGGVDDGK